MAIAGVGIATARATIHRWVKPVEEVSFYTYGDREYFETPRRFPIASTYADVVRGLLPAGWRLTHFDTWLLAKRDEAEPPMQGFKIHLSSSLRDADAMLRRLAPVCTSADVMFKVVADPALHGFMNSKRYSRAGSGKFAAIYPRDEAQFLGLLDALAEAMAGLDGPYILSDNRYRDSKVVFYRYGAFRRVERVNIDGTRSLMMYAPDGSLLTDDRTPYFRLPSWVIDPVPPPAAPAPADTASELLNGRYELDTALTFSNTGGVYRAVDTTTGRLVVVKEARPHTLTWAGAAVTMEAAEALRHEHACLQRLQGVPCVPAAIELYEEWEHTFLVVEYFEGTSLATLRAREDFILMVKMHDSAAVRRYCWLWVDLCRRLLADIRDIHARGIIVGDISPTNILVDEVTGQLAFIDLEGASPSDASEHVAKFGTQWFNPGFRKVGSRLADALTAADDFYSCGMLLYNLVCPTQTMLELDTAHPVFRMLDHFIDAGLPKQIRDIIQLLLDGNGVEAEAAALAWHREGMPEREALCV